MGRPRSIPSYCLHKPTQQAYVRFPEPFQGKTTHYLGDHGTREQSPRSWEKYDRLIAEWLLDRHRPAGLPPAGTLAVTELVAAYLRFAEGHYVKDGKPTKQMRRIKVAVGPLCKLYGSEPAASLTPKRLLVVRAEMAKCKWTRGFINSCIGCLKRIWDWGVVEELVPGEVAAALRAVKGLRKGAKDVEPTRKVSGVDPAVVQRTLPQLSQVVRDMVQVQYLSAMRPVEVCGLRPCDVNRKGEMPDGTRFPGVWVYVVPDESNKEDHEEIPRYVFLGPRAQKILKPYLDRDPVACCFSPREAAEQYLVATGRTINHRRERAPGIRYRTEAYDKAIAKAAKRARVPHWSPNQLRHRRATEIRSRFGPDTARVVLGHSIGGMTATYAEADLEQAADCMRKMG